MHIYIYTYYMHIAFLYTYIHDLVYFAFVPEEARQTPTYLFELCYRPLCRLKPTVSAFHSWHLSPLFDNKNRGF